MRSTIIAALAVLPSVYAISLSDFKPYLTDLPDACETVYTQQVLGCTADDFSGKGCSKNCVGGLRLLVAPLALACSNAKVFDTTNVLNTFLTSDGVKSLCPNAAAAAPRTSSSSTTSTTQQPTTTSTPTTTAATTTDQPTTSSSATPSTTAQSTQAPLAVTESSSSSSSTTSSSTSTISLATSSAIFIYSTSSTDVASSTSSAPAARATQGTSGGGSPFDTTNSMASGLSAGSVSSFVLFLSALLAAYIL